MYQCQPPCRPLLLPSRARRAAPNRLFLSPGDPKFLALATRFAYGDDSTAIAEGRVAALQALSGTGSLRVGFEVLKRFHGATAPVCIPNPTWGNHPNIIRVRVLAVCRCLVGFGGMRCPLESLL